MKLASLLDDFIDVYFKKGLSSKFFIGFTCGVPFILRLAILDLWLKDQGLSNSLIGIITLLQFPFTFKFLWAPFIEKFNFPFLSKTFGQRKGWAIASQMLLFVGVIGMATSSPNSSLFRLLFFTSLVAFADGCQDMSLYTFQLPKTDSQMYGPTAGVYVFGYRTGLFFSKSITLYLAHCVGWNAAYFIMAFSIFLCTLFILRIDEPRNEISSNNSDLHPLKIITSTMKQCLFDPFKNFMKQSDWKSFIAVIMLYRAGDILAQKMARLFYLDLGFSILDIANVVQVFGSIATLFGGVIGGYFIKKLGIIRSMIWFGVIHASSCLCYVILAFVGKNLLVFYFSVFVENITSGAVVTAFVAFLYSLSHKNYAATQYALLWAFYDLGGTFYRTVSGIIADALGWTNFFLIIPLTFIPCLIILLSIRDYPEESVVAVSE
jgi:PAT family beta-lactamase induction signal transducer AmpG